MDNLTTTIEDLDFRFGELMMDPNRPFTPRAKGFTIGSTGRQLHWYIAHSKYGSFLAFPQYKNGELGHPRYLKADQQITIHYINSNPQS